MIKMLTGQKFEISVLLDFCFSRGTTRAIFDKSEKILYSILDLIDLVKSGVKKATASF